MLVLSRKLGEDIIIEGNGRTVIRILHVNADGSQVKLGLEAPRDISISRAEIRTPFPCKPPQAAWPSAPLPIVEVATIPAVPG